MNKQNIPQLNDKGLSYDYNNSFGSLFSALDIIANYSEDECRKLFELNKDDYVLEKIIFETYNERYPLTEYEYEVTDDVKKINQYGLELRSLLEHKSYDYVKLFNLMDDMYFIINSKHLADK